MRCLRVSWRERLAEEDGVSLIEILLAGFILSVAVLALASVASASMIQVRVSRDRQAATDAATSTLESMRLEDFASVAMRASEVAAAGLGSCDGGSAGEPYVVTADSSQGISHQTTGLGPRQNITVTTKVTWVDEAGVADCATSDRKLKRVRVAAAWEDRGLERVVSQETIVAPARRGLPLPEFRLGSPDVSVNFDPDEIANPTEKCVTHVLRNIGAADRYDWTVVRTDGAEPPAKLGSVEFRSNNGSTAGGRWYVRAFFEYSDPLSETIPDVRATPAPSGVEVMTDTDVNGRPEAQAVVPNGSQGRLHVCYRPEGSIATDHTFTFRVTVHSRFDENATASVNHSLTTSRTPVTWYLYDTDDSTSHPRKTSANKIPVYFMGPLTELQPEVLGTTASLQDYDTDLDGLGRGGIRLPNNDATLDAVWHQQLSVTREFIPTATLTLNVSTSTILAGGEIPQDQRVRVVIQRVGKNENTVVDTWTPTGGHLHSYTHDETLTAGDGWMFQVITIPLVSAAGKPLVVEADQFLRVQVRCGSTSQDHCHVAYDHHLYPSNLRVTTK